MSSESPRGMVQGRDQQVLLSPGSSVDVSCGGHYFTEQTGMERTGSATLSCGMEPHVHTLCIAYSVILVTRNFLWVELHGNYTSWNKLECKIYVVTLHEPQTSITEHNFPENPSNT